MTDWIWAQLGRDINDESPTADDAALVAIRQIVHPGTIRSIKKTILACLLIWTIQRSRIPRRRVVVSLALLVPVVLVAVHYWHGWSTFAHLLR
jgi:hypothetical protein